MSEYKIVIGYWTLNKFAGEFYVVNGEFSALWSLMNTLLFTRVSNYMYSALIV